MAPICSDWIKLVEADYELISCGMIAPTSKQLFNWRVKTKALDDIINFKAGNINNSKNYIIKVLLMLYYFILNI